MNHTWDELNRDDILRAISEFKETDSANEHYFLVFDGVEYPARKLRKFAYELKFSPEKLTTDDMNGKGGGDAKKFFENPERGFKVIEKYDSWTIISEDVAVKKCDKSFFEHGGSGIPIPVRGFFDAENLNDGEKVSVSLIYEGQSYNGEITQSAREATSQTRIFWRGTDLGEQFDIYRPEENGEYPEAEFKKVAENTYEITISTPSDSSTISVNDSIWLAAAVMSYEKYYKDNCRNITDYSLVQSDIRGLAQTFTNGTVDAARTSWWCCGDQARHTRAYLRAIEPNSKRRLAFPGEFSDSVTEPSDLDQEMTIETNVGYIKIKQLYEFVHTEYAAMENQVLKTSIDYIGVLNYLNDNQEIPYSNPDAPGLDPEKKEKLLAIKEKGQAAVNEMKKMAFQCQGEFNLDKCLPGSWLDGSNTKTRKYLWTQMKYSAYSDDPTSISIFVEKNGDLGARYRIALELKNDGTDKKTIARYHSYLELPIDPSSGLVLAQGSNEWGHPEVINDPPEKVKSDVAEGKYRKVQLCKYIERKPDETNEYFHKELMAAVKQLIPYYEHVLGIKPVVWWPSKDEYDPGITVEQWVEILNDPEITTDKNLRMFAEWLDYDKPAACSEIAEHYGETKNFFNAGSSAMAKRIVDKGKCPAPPYRDNENARWWPVIYVGRDAEKQEKGSYIWKLRDEVSQALEQIELPEIEEAIKMSNKNKFNVNTILYGPPGTGKTYNTVRIAVSICEPDLNVDEMEFEDVLKKYEELKEEGRIEFTTFHQSYGYEEFIEGIKPILASDPENAESKDIKYDVIPGVFKKFCKNASWKWVKLDEEYLQDDAKIWKVTIRNEVLQDCFDNDRVRIDWEIDSKGAAAFVNEMYAGDVIITTDGSRSCINGIAKVISEEAFELDADADKTTRKVVWLAKNISFDITGINDEKILHRMTVARVPSMRVKSLIPIIKTYNPEMTEKVEKEEEPYVFIIDEINRGNISKIFGELITLIEVTKRDGADEAMETTLPYSGEPFSVPNNVYILGTMNTADRSIALMDTALRRRFDFVEMMPDTSVIEGIRVEADDEVLDVAKMLDAINTRIEYLYDREHTIGHAFFTRLRKNPSMNCLAEIFKNNVVPLLQEYFYEDYEKIQLVLGDNDKSSDAYKFILDKKVNENEIFKKSPQLDLHEKTYEIQNGAFDKIRSYIEITETRKEED